MKRIANELRLLIAAKFCDWAGDMLEKAGEPHLALEAYNVSIQAGLIEARK